MCVSVCVREIEIQREVKGKSVKEMISRGVENGKEELNNVRAG